MFHKINSISSFPRHKTPKEWACYDNCSKFDYRLSPYISGTYLNKCNWCGLLMKSLLDLVGRGRWRGRLRGVRSRKVKSSPPLLRAKVAKLQKGSDGGLGLAGVGPDGDEEGLCVAFAGSEHIAARISERALEGSPSPSAEDSSGRVLYLMPLFFLILLRASEVYLCDHGPRGSPQSEDEASRPLFCLIRMRRERLVLYFAIKMSRLASESIPPRRHEASRRLPAARRLWRPELKTSLAVATFLKFENIQTQHL